MSSDLPTATIDIRRDRRHAIDPLIYGHFLESAFFGNIEGGVFDEGSPLSYDGDGARNGLRTDVIKLCRELGLPIVRWPGGNFTSPYHWEDGIGPRADRPGHVARARELIEALSGTIEDGRIRRTFLDRAIAQTSGGGGG